MGFLTRAKALFSGNEGTTSTGGGLFVNGNYESDKKLITQAEFSWAFVAMNAIAKEIATTPLKLYKDKGDDIEEVEEHEAIEKLLAPNPAQTDYDILWTTIMHQLAIGEAAWLFDEESNDFTVFSPELMTVNKDKHGAITSIDVTTTGGLQTFDGEHAILLKQPSIKSPLEGKGTLTAISRTVELDMFMEEHLRVFFLNNATPQGFLSPKNKDGITPEYLKRLIVNLNNRHKGVNKAHKFGVLEHAMEWIQTGASLSDQNIQETSNAIRKKILATFGVPEAILGITDGVRANSDVADKVFARRTIRPMLLLMEKQLNRYYLPKFDNAEGLYFKFDEVVKEDEKLNAEINAIYLTAGVKTTDEVRGELGLEALDTEPVESTEDKMKRILAHKKQLKEDAKPKVKTTYTDDEITDYHEKKLSFTDEHERQLQAELEVFFEKQGDRIARSITNSKASGENVEYDSIPESDITVLEALLATYAFDTIVFQSRNTNALMGLVDQITKKDKVAQEFVKERSHKTAESVIKNVQTRVDKAVIGAENAVRAKDAVGSLYTNEIIKNKPVQVAVTEVSTAAGWATITTYKRLERVPAGKQWITVGDERTCQYCSPMSGVMIPLENKYWNTNERMIGLEGGTLDFKFSGGVDVYPMHSNCRCSLVPVFNEGLIPEKPFSYKDDLKKMADFNYMKTVLDNKEKKMEEFYDKAITEIADKKSRLKESQQKHDEDVTKLACVDEKLDEREKQLDKILKQIEGE